MIMAEDISNYGQKLSISVSVTPENTESLDYILQNYLTLSLIPFCTSIFCKNRVLNFTNFTISQFFYVFCKDPDNSIGLHLKSCYNFVFLCFRINKVTGNLNTKIQSLAYFAISKLTNKSKYF